MWIKGYFNHRLEDPNNPIASVDDVKEMEENQINFMRRSEAAGMTPEKLDDLMGKLGPEID